MFVSRILPAMAATLLAAATAFGQPLNSYEQKCVNTINKGMGSISKAEWAAFTKCARAYAKDPTIDFYECFDLSPKPLTSTIKAIQKADAVCSIDTPDFGNFNETSPPYALGGGEYLASVLLADYPVDPVDGIALCASDGAACKCQTALFASTGKLLGLYLSLFNKCKKLSMNDGTIVDLATMGECLSDSTRLDPTDKLVKANEKLTSRIGTKCVDQGVSDPFPAGVCAAPTDGAALSGCMQVQVRCTACQYVMAVDEAELDCDTFDDGLLNASCDCGCTP